jgi:hypothetical protein
MLREPFIECFFKEKYNHEGTKAVKNPIAYKWDIAGVSVWSNTR